MKVAAGERCAAKRGALQIAGTAGASLLSSPKPFRHAEMYRENGYVEGFNARLRDELLNGEVFYTLREASVVIEQWRTHYNSIRPPLHERARL